MERLGAETLYPIWKIVRFNIMSDVQYNVGFETLTDTHRQLQNQVWDEVRNQVGNEVRIDVGRMMRLD